MENWTHAQPFDIFSMAPILFIRRGENVFGDSNLELELILFRGKSARNVAEVLRVCGYIESNISGKM